MNTKKNDPRDAEWRRICSTLTRDSVRISVPRAFLSILTLFFHHVSDAMAGDDRPDHGLAQLRQGREHYRVPFYLVYGKCRRAEDTMSEARRRKAARTFYRYIELLKERDETWLFKNKRARALVRQGLEEARQGRLVRAKEDFSKHVTHRPA